MNFDLSKYAKIDESTSETRANALLEKGWELITVLPYECKDSDITRCAMYVLGWKRESGEPIYAL